jgi:hypothetical protein
MNQTIEGGNARTTIAPDKVNVLDIIDQADLFLESLFKRVALKSPHYENARKLQQSIHLFNKNTSRGKVKATKEKAEIAYNFIQSGLTVREVAAIMGYKHPGSISHLLSKQKPKQH